MIKRILVITFFIFIANCSITIADLVAHWDFEENSGYTALEKVSSNNALLKGGAQLNGCGYVQLDGLDDYIELPIGSVVSSLNSCTIAVDFYFTGQGGSWQRLFTFGNGTSEFANLVFSSTDDNEIVVKKRYDSHDEVLYADAKDTFRSRHYYVLTIDSVNRTTTLYVDGVVCKKETETSFKFSSLGQTTNNWIGKSQYSSGNYLNGRVYDFKIYDNVLSPQQISELAQYNGPIKPVPEDNAKAVDPQTTLSWDSTIPAQSYNVYLGTDYTDVLNANITSTVFQKTTYSEFYETAKLKNNTKYYWRVDQQLSTGTIKGPVWCFKTNCRGNKLGLMSFNIKCDYGFGFNENDWVYSFGDDRRDKVFEIILTASKTFQAAGPEILGVQEALKHQVEDLSEALNGYDFYGIGRDDGDDSGEQCAIFYKTARFDRTDQGTFWLSETPQEPGSVYPGAYCTRIASWVKLKDKLNNKTYLVVNTHWDHVGEEARQYSATLIKQKIQSLGNNDAVIVMGDFNATEDTAEYETMTNSSGIVLKDSFRQVHTKRHADELSCHGWKGGNSGSRIDFILHSDNLSAENAIIENASIANKYPSDHYPLTAVLAVPIDYKADLNKDGIVDYNDLTIFAGDWLKSDSRTEVATPPQEALEGHWDFSGPAGSTVVQDLAGDNNALIKGQASLDGSGKVTLAGGDSGQYIDLGASLGNLLAAMDAFTLVADIEWYGNEKGTWQKIWNFSQDGTSEYSSLMFVSENEEYLRYLHRYDSHDDITNVSTPNLIGRHHIAVFYDPQAGYSGFGQVKIFVDGFEVGGHSCDCDNSLAVANPTLNNWLGKSPYASGNYFWGSFYDFKIYSAVLTKPQIAYLASNGNGTLIPLDSVADIFTESNVEHNIVNFSDFSVFASSWFDYYCN